VNAASGAKLDAVALVAERLERRAAGSRKPDHVFVNANDVARELRAILDFKVPAELSDRALLEAVRTDFERASLELGLWSQRFAEVVAWDVLTGALLSEVSMIHLDGGMSREEHLARCGAVWETIEAARAELGGEQRCGDTDCGACAVSGEASGQG
jgi:hypothetical protein